MQDEEAELTDHIASRQSALGLLLAFVGAGMLVALMVVTPQMLGEPDGMRWRPWILAVGVWGLIAVSLGLRLRRSEASRPLIAAAGVWLVPAIGMGLWASFQ